MTADLISRFYPIVGGGRVFKGGVSSGRCTVDGEGALLILERLLICSLLAPVYIDHAHCCARPIEARVNEPAAEQLSPLPLRMETSPTDRDLTHRVRRQPDARRPRAAHDVYCVDV